MLISNVCELGPVCKVTLIIKESEMVLTKVSLSNRMIEEECHECSRESPGFGSLVNCEIERWRVMVPQLLAPVWVIILVLELDPELILLG